VAGVRNLRQVEAVERARLLDVSPEVSRRPGCFMVAVPAGAVLSAA